MHEEFFFTEISLTFRYFLITVILSCACMLVPTIFLQTLITEFLHV